MLTSSALMASEPVVSAAVAASEWGSEKSMLMMRKKLWRSKSLRQQVMGAGLGDHDGGEDRIQNFGQGDGNGGRRAGAREAVRPAAAAGES